MGSVSEVVAVFGAVTALSAFVSQLIHSRNQYLNEKAYRRVMHVNTLDDKTPDFQHPADALVGKNHGLSHYTTITTTNINPKQLDIETSLRRRIMAMQTEINRYLSEVSPIEAAVIN